MISFDASVAASPANVDDLLHTHREVLDISEADELIVELPYLLEEDWQYRSDPLGQLTLSVVNPIRCPETCSASVIVYMFVRGGHDFQVATPGNVFSRPIVFQSETVRIGGGKVSDEIMLPAEEAMSELPLSLRQYLKQYRPVFPFVSTSGDTQMVISPWALGAASYVSSVQYAPTQIASDVHSTIHAPYAFMRGGVRIRTVPSSEKLSNAVNPVSGAVSFVKNFTGWCDWSTPYVASGSSAAFVTPITGNVTSLTFPTPGLEPVVSGSKLETVSVQVPWAERYRFTPISWSSKNFVNLPVVYPKATVQYGSDGSMDSMVARAYADDYQVLFWVGCPTMLYW